jgi:hypothetical protein
MIPPDPDGQEQGSPGGPGGVAQHQPDDARQIVPGVCTGNDCATANVAATTFMNAIAAIPITLGISNILLKIGHIRQFRCEKQSV